MFSKRQFCASLLSNTVLYVSKDFISDSALETGKDSALSLPSLCAGIVADHCRNKGNVCKSHCAASASCSLEEEAMDISHHMISEPLLLLGE